MGGKADAAFEIDQPHEGIGLPAPVRQRLPERHRDRRPVGMVVSLQSEGVRQPIEPVEAPPLADPAHPLDRALGRVQVAMFDDQRAIVDVDPAIIALDLVEIRTDLLDQQIGRLARPEFLAAREQAGQRPQTRIIGEVLLGHAARDAEMRFRRAQPSLVQRRQPGMEIAIV